MAIIDFHTHIFPKDIIQNRSKFFNCDPAFTLLYNSSKSKLVGIAELIESMDENHIDVSLIFGFPWENYDVLKRHNDYIIEASNKFPGRFKGFCCINPFNVNACYEVLRCIECGLSGVGEIAFYQSGIEDESIKRLTPIMEICLKKNLPVLIHTNEPVGHIYPGKSPILLKQIHNFIKQFNNNKIVLAHWGGGIFFYNLLKKEFKSDLNNIYFDTAASPFLYDFEVYQIALKIIGDNKIIFGSDFPLLKPQRYFEEFEKALLSNKQKNNICYNNAAFLLNI